MNAFNRKWTLKELNLKSLEYNRVRMTLVSFNSANKWSFQALSYRSIYKYCLQSGIQINNVYLSPLISTAALLVEINTTIDRPGLGWLGGHYIHTLYPSGHKIKSYKAKDRAWWVTKFTTLVSFYNGITISSTPKCIHRSTRPNPQSGPVMITIFPHMLSSIRLHFSKISSENNIATGGTVCLAEWIIDDTCAILFQVPPDSIERAAGLLFFDKLSRNQLKKINGKKTGWF